jgi:hypothetical protein
MSAGFRRWILIADGAFLALVGTAAMVADAVGHFLGRGPMARMLDSPHSIGGFEAHGLAVLIGLLLLRAARAPAPLWHAVGVAVHVRLGLSNLIFWPSFAYLDVVATGVATTLAHAVLACAQALCLGRGRASPA